QYGDARAQVRFALVGRAAEQVALREDGGGLAGEPSEAARGGGEDHMREAWMQAETRHRAPMRRRPALRIERAKLRQQVAGLRQVATRRWTEEGEAVPRAGAPDRQLESERRQVGGQDLRYRMRCAGPLIRFGPQADADAGTEPARPPAPLVGGRLAGPHG